ncbi:MerR family transcriptional regulator [Corallococcus sp. CA054B]|uniref:MerR family transcriptional regulator n=1 Tax=Corallococcus sp. CA054B TaxID=2316734 RepID=UPI000EA1C64B|nr:MerR family transcriptional regulator [Corallococcus sp. CA054B]RKG66646.1 MerR family transcriptional regulator [Corallococcus sp. CA054B]
MESMDLLAPDELERIERENAGGLPANAILEIFRPRGVRLSEATFRKYVQAGLLPRSRRVGRKGKHQGSLGLYPVEAVRRINVIKRMMAEGHTLEDIRRSFVFHRNHIDQLQRDLSEVLDGFQEELGGRPLGGERRRSLEAQLATLRQRAQDLVRDVARLGSAVTAREDETLRPQ